MSIRKRSFPVAGLVPTVCLIIAFLFPSMSAAQIHFTDLSRFVLGSCTDIEQELLEEGARKVVPAAGEGRLSVFGVASGALRKEVYVVCYGEAEFRGQPADELNGRVAGILIRFTEIIDDMKDVSTVYDDSHLAPLGRSALGLYTRKEMPEFFRIAPFQFAAKYSNGLGEFRIAGLTKRITVDAIPIRDLETRIRWRSYGYQDQMESPEVHVVSDFYMGPKAGVALPYRWGDRELKAFAVTSLKGWIQELRGQGR